MENIKGETRSEYHAGNNFKLDEKQNYKILTEKLLGKINITSHLDGCGELAICISEKIANPKMKCNQLYDVAGCVYEKNRFSIYSNIKYALRQWDDKCAEKLNNVFGTDLFKEKVFGNYKFICTVAKLIELYPEKISKE